MAASPHGILGPQQVHGTRKAYKYWTVHATAHCASAEAASDRSLIIAAHKAAATCAVALDIPVQPYWALSHRIAHDVHIVFLLQGKDKEQPKKDEKRSAERVTPDGKAAAEKDVKPAAAVIDGGDKGALAAGEPAAAADAAEGQPKQETANGAAPTDSDAPGDKVSAAVVVGIGIHGRVSADALVQKGCHSAACRVHMMSRLARSLSSQSEAAPLS
jgi:hypothetical protein